MRVLPLIVLIHSVGLSLGVSFDPVSVLLPLSGREQSEGAQYKQTAELAVQLINNQSWFAGHKLELTFEDTQSTSFGAWQAAQSAVGPSATTKPLVLVGPSYSAPALAASVSARNARIPMVLFDATNPALSRIPDFVLRTCATDELYAQALVALLRAFDWGQFGAVYSATDYGRGFKEQLALAVSQENGGGGGAEGGLFMRVAAEFAPCGAAGCGVGGGGGGGGGSSDEELEVALKQVREANLRVVALLAHPAEAARVMRLAARRGMTGKGWLWIGPEWSTAEMLAAAGAAAGAAGAADKDAVAALAEAMGGMLGLVPDNGNAALRAALRPAGVLPASVSVAHAGALFDALWLVADRHVASEAAAGADLFYALANGTTAARPSPIFGGRPVALGAASRARSNAVLQLVNFAPVAAGSDSGGDSPGGFAFRTVATFAQAGQPGGGGALAFGPGGPGAIVWAGGQHTPPSDRGSASIAESATYFFLVLLGLVGAYVADALLHEYQVHALPASGATILFGVLIGALVKAIGSAKMIAAAKFDEQLFTLILLPIIVFESGYAMHRTHFFSQLGSIVTFAVFGTLTSTLFIGLVLHAVSESAFGLVLPIEEALAFAALISAVDPVATLTIFGALKVEPSLNALVYGESIINDAVSIVLYRAFVRFFEQEVTAVAIFGTLGSFLAISIGSVFFGVLVTVLCALTFKLTNELANNALRASEELECLVLLMYSYMAFALAEAAHCSGIVSAVVAGIAMNHFAKPNVSRDGQAFANKCLHFVAHLAEGLIFFQVGLNVVLYNASINWGFIFLTIVLCLIGRALNIFPLAFILNRKRTHHRITLNQQVAMWHAGLRGAIAYALAITFPSHHQDVIISTTSFVVLFTVFVLGGSTVPMLRFLDVRRGIEEDHAKRMSVVRTAKAESAWKRVWIRFASEKLVPWLSPAGLGNEDEDALVLDTDGAPSAGIARLGDVEITSASAWDMGDADEDAAAAYGGGGSSSSAVTAPAGSSIGNRTV
jgi:sodium/hydrogen exchanger 8